MRNNMTSLAGYTVKDMIELLKTIPKDFNMGFFGEPAPALVVDEKNGVVAIDSENWFLENEEEE